MSLFPLQYNKANVPDFLPHLIIYPSWVSQFAQNWLSLLSIIQQGLINSFLCFINLRNTVCCLDHYLPAKDFKLFQEERFVECMFFNTKLLDDSLHPRG